MARRARSIGSADRVTLCCAVNCRIIWRVFFALNGTKPERVSGLKTGR